MSQKNEIRDARLTDTRSARLSIVKKLWATRRSIFFLSRKDEETQTSFAMNLGNKFLWDELTKAGYDLSWMSKQEAIQILYSDVQSVKGFSETRNLDLYRLACKIAPYILKLSKPKQKQSFKVAFSVFKISQGNDTNRVGASVRARVELQKEYFGAAVKKEHQNAVLAALCELGFGELNRGTSYLGASLEDDKMPSLSFVTLAYPNAKEEIEEVDFIEILLGLNLLNPNLAGMEFTADNKTTAQLDPETGLHAIVEGKGSVAFQKFCAILDSMDDAYKAFKNYCDTTSAEYTLIREAWKGSEEGKAVLAAKREAELLATAEREVNNVVRTVAAEAKTKKKINITAKRQEMLDLGLAILVEDGTRLIQFNISPKDKELVLSGKMVMVNGVPRWNHDMPSETVEQDYSWAEKLIANSDADVVEVRVDRYAGMTQDEKRAEWAKDREIEFAHAFDDILASL